MSLTFVTQIGTSTFGREEWRQESGVCGGSSLLGIQQCSGEEASRGGGEASVHV